MEHVRESEAHMTDIVERLRLGAQFLTVCDEAADEIEQLRALLAATERDLEKALTALDHHMKM